MSAKNKLLGRLKASPKDFTFSEAETLLLSLGFVKSNKGKTSGSRVLFTKGSVKIDLHRPHPRKELYRYQIAEIVRTLREEGLI